MKIATKKQLLEQFPAIRERTLRYWIQQAYPREVSRQGRRCVIPGNGLATALIKVGRVIYFDVERFTSWLEAHRVSGTPHESRDMRHPASSLPGIKCAK